MIILLIADGRSIHTQRWAEYFAQKGHRVHLISYESMSRSVEGVTEHVLTSRWKNLYLAFIPRHLTILRLLNQINPDIIHAHFIAKYGFHLPFLGNYPKIVSAWGDDILILPKSSRLIFMFTKYVLTSVDLIYAVSEDIRSHIIHDFRISPEKVKYLPFGVDTVKFFPGKSTQKDNTIITLFSNRGFLPIYGMDIILESFIIAHAKIPALKLILKGEGPDKEKIKKAVLEKKLEENVLFLDTTEYSEIPLELQKMDIFITAAGRDGTPVSLLEAMATGLPCIATSVGGIPEWIVDDSNGLIIPPFDSRILAEKMLQLAADKEKREFLGKNARDTIVRKGNWSLLMQIAENDYETLKVHSGK